MFVVLIAFTLIALASLIPWQPAGLTPWQLRVLSVVAAGLILWISESLPVGVTSLVVVGGLALVAPGDSDEATRAALSGFASPAPYFLLGTLALAAATAKSGLAGRFARLLVRGARGSANRLYVQSVLLMPPMAVLVPSALTRSVMLIPTYEEVFQRHRIHRGARLPRLVMLTLALVQIQASTAVLTGGTVPVVAAQLAGGLSWGRYFLFMALPNYVILFALAAVLYLLYRPLRMPPARESGDEEPGAMSPMSGMEKRTLLVLGGATLLWLTDSIHGLNPALPALMGAVALFLPGINVLDWREFEDSRPWAVFFVIGASLSLASALERSETATWIADRILALVPLQQFALLPQLLALMVVVIAVNVLLPNRAAVLGITVPLLTSLATPLGLNPFVLALMVPIVAQTANYYPVQIATALITYQTRHYSAGELLRAGLLLTVIGVLVILLVALPYWALLGEPIQV